MMACMRARTLSVSILRDPKSVYAFVSNLENLPQWATTFCRSATRSNDGWTIDTPQGPMTMRVTGNNDLGIVDHAVIPADGAAVFVPMRIVPNGPGSEVLFTLFQRPGMSDDQYAQDMRLVEQDLTSLKRVMETV